MCARVHTRTHTHTHYKIIQMHNFKSVATCQLCFRVELDVSLYSWGFPEAAYKMQTLDFGILSVNSC